MDLNEEFWQGVEWIHVPDDSDHWHAARNTAVNLRVHKLCLIY
jgi:hypothetical protein